jgi:hypothetical protein
MNPQRFCELQYEIFRLQGQINNLRQELKTYDNHLMSEFMRQQPGELVPLPNIPNHVVTHEVNQRLPNITQLNLMNLLLQFWKQCNPTATDDVILQKAEKQFDMLMSYRQPIIEHKFLVKKVDDVTNYIQYRNKHQEKRHHKENLSKRRKRTRLFIKKDISPNEN